MDVAHLQQANVVVCTVLLKVLPAPCTYRQLFLDDIMLQCWGLIRGLCASRASAA
jgi:hypothetical protein